MLGQMNQQIILPSLQGAKQPPLGIYLRPQTLTLPLAIDGVHIADGRMVAEQRRGFLIDKRIDFKVRCTSLEERENRRAKQHITVVAQFDDQNPADALQIDTVVQHDANNSKKRSAVTAFAIFRQAKHLSLSRLAATLF